MADTSALDSDDGSYEEIVVSDEEEYLEYYEEILDEDSGSEFTEVTAEDETVDDQNDPVLDNLEEKVSEMENQSAAILDTSSSNLSLEASNHRARRQSSRMSMIRRPVIKTAMEKALEQEQARIAKEESEIKFKLARHDSFLRKDKEILERLQEEEEQHIREEEESEQQRIEEENRLAQLRADEAAARIKAQKEDEERERLMKLEKERLAKEAEERKIEQEKAAKEKEAADKARKEKEEAGRLAREKAKREMEEEVRKLEAELAEKKRHAAEAEAKRVAEQARLQAKVQERRQAKKEQEAQVPTSNVTQVATNTSNATQASSKAVDQGNTTYYSIEDLRKMSIPGLDYKNREIYLSPSDFKLVFEMTREEFEEQPKWKKTTLKRKAKLF